MPGSEIDINQLVGKNHQYELTVNNESPEDAAARRVQEAAEAAQKRKITFCIFIFAIVLIGVVFAGCVYVFATGLPEDKKWAASVVSAIASGLVGFLVGQAKK